MSKRYIVKLNDLYLTPRRATKSLYQSRSQLSDQLEDARIFNTKGAAKNSKYPPKPIGYDDYAFVVVEVKLIEVNCNE